MKPKTHAFFRLAKQHPIPTTIITTVALTTLGYTVYANRDKDIAVDRDGIVARHPQDAAIRTGNVIADEGSNTLSANGPRASIFTQDIKAKRDNTLTVNGHNPTAVSPSNSQSPRP